MDQKIIWRRYLIIGINYFFISLFANCEKNTIVEYKLDADIIFINETNHLIRYYQYNSENNKKVFILELKANSEKKIEMRGSGGNQYQTRNNCCDGLFESFQGKGPVLIDYNNNDKCITYSNGEGSTTRNIAAYESRTISDKYYEFKYIFTEEEYNQAEDCE